MARKHAKYSPSSMERTYSCWPSVLYSEELPTPPSSSYAQEGTDAHACCEHKLGVSLGIDVGLYDSKKWNQEMHAIADAYTDFCIEKASDYGDGCTSSQPFIELKVCIDMKRGIWGTADFVHVVVDSEDDTAKALIIDFKYGRGKVVNPENNHQLKCYALGVKNTVRSKLGIQVTEVAYDIYQPRIHTKPEWTIEELKGFLESYTGEGYGVYTDDELVAYEKSIYDKIDFIESKRKELKKKEAKAVNTIAIDELSPGAWCHFCPARVFGVCLAHTKELTTQTESKISKILNRIPDKPAKIKKELELGILSDEQAVFFSGIAPKLRAFLSAVESYLEERLLSGERISGVGLVEKSWRRKYIDDEQKVADTLISLGVDEPFEIKKSLKSITALEKEFGAGLFKGSDIVISKKPETDAPNLKLAVDDVVVEQYLSRAQDRLEQKTKDKMNK